MSIEIVNQRYTNARMRKDIYQFLREEGFEITEERHQAIKHILANWENAAIKELREKYSVAMQKLARK